MNKEQVTFIVVLALLGLMYFTGGESSSRRRGGSGALATSSLLTCPFRKLYPRILMVQPAEERVADDASRRFDFSMNRRVFGDSEVRPHGIVVIGVGGEDTA